MWFQAKHDRITKPGIVTAPKRIGVGSLACFPSIPLPAMRTLHFDRTAVGRQVHYSEASLIAPATPPVAVAAKKAPRLFHRCSHLGTQLVLGGFFGNLFGLPPGRRGRQKLRLLPFRQHRYPSAFHIAPMRRLSAPISRRPSAPISLLSICPISAEENGQQNKHANNDHPGEIHHMCLP
jgi:hypothetical protein